MPHQKGNSHNLRLALRESAIRRKCPACGRKGALRKPIIRHYETVSTHEEDCRYCGHTVSHVFKHSEAPADAV